MKLKYNYIVYKNDIMFLLNILKYDCLVMLFSQNQFREFRVFHFTKNNNNYSEIIKKCKLKKTCNTYSL